MTLSERCSLPAPFSLRFPVPPARWSSFPLHPSLTAEVPLVQRHPFLLLAPVLGGISIESPRSAHETSSSLWPDYRAALTENAAELQLQNFPGQRTTLY